MGSWKTAWKTALKLAGAILSGDPDAADAAPLVYRIHDTTHTAKSDAERRRATCKGRQNRRMGAEHHG